MKTIFKTVLSPDSQSKIVAQVPGSAEFLSAGVQHGEAVIWYTCYDENDTKKDWHFLAIPTGADVKENLCKYDFIQTLQFMGGTFILHLFKLKSNIREI